MDLYVHQLRHVFHALKDMYCPESQANDLESAGCIVHRCEEHMKQRVDCVEKKAVWLLLLLFFSALIYNYDVLLIPESRT